MEPESVGAASIGARVARAREDLSLTQAALGEAIGLDRTAIAKIETGRRNVSAPELVRLAEALDRPIDWFVTDSPPAVISRRADPAAGGQSALLDRRIERLARDVAYLGREGILPEPTEHRLEMPAELDEAEEAAAVARRLLDAPTGPLLDLQRQCESLGLLAFSLDLGPEGRDGAYVAANRWGVALVNGFVDPGRRRFNLAHELAHHLFADAYAPEVTISAGSETERLINAFVAHLLLPRADILRVRTELGEPFRAAVALAARYRASWVVVCNQLKNLGIVDDSVRDALAAAPPTKADFMEVGELWIPELESPSVPRGYGRRVLGAYRTGRLTRARTVELLWGTVSDEELPEQQAIPLEGLHREFEPLP